MRKHTVTVAIVGKVLAVRELDEYDQYQAYKMLVETDSGTRSRLFTRAAGSSERTRALRD